MAEKPMEAFIFSLNTRVEADETNAPIRNAADILKRDMREVLTGRGPENAIRAEIDSRLAAEEYRAEVGPAEIRVTGGDDLGVVYGLLSLSERLLGVKPLDWWMERRPERRETVSVPVQEWKSPARRVRFRSWFVNDEVLFTGWHMEEALRYQVWKRTFETILRCGGNMVIPGTDREYDGRVLTDMALDLGLWVTQHHSELLGARMFGRVYPDLTPSYVLYPEKYEALWQEAIDRYAGKRILWCIGFRGQGDHAFWDDDGSGFDTDEKRGRFISSVMRRQMEMTRAKDPDALFSTNLYGELMGLYRQGYLTVPEEVVKIWGDNGFGRMISRRQENLNPRVDAMPGPEEPGRHGIYYHVSFYDLQAANHITMLQVPVSLVIRELERVLERKADTLWNINVGSVRPHLFMLEIVRRMWQDGRCDPEEAARDFAEDYYGGRQAAGVLTGYSECAVKYGPHEDDLAGDQYYHWPLRALARALLRGETAQPVESMIWAAGNVPFPEQVRIFGENVRPGIASWKAYLKRIRDLEASLPEEEAERLEQTMGLQGLIHASGCEGLYSFCQACLHCLNGDDLQAYLWTDRALQAARKALQAMDAVPGRFAHYYDNDCFAGVRVTVQTLEGVRAWLRIRGDSERLFGWEKQYLIPAEETRVTLQSHRTTQLSDEEMCRRLRGRVPLKTAL
ncbi:MAG: glycosyl hydrolase 115 family protein [Clostridia bacterium]|nr:glycosyl hydrolase 115 family protein [Clostridia bacterium]